MLYSYSSQYKRINLACKGTIAPDQIGMKVQIFLCHWPKKNNFFYFIMRSVFKCFNF